MRTPTPTRARNGTSRPAPDAAPDDEVGVTDLNARDYLSILKRAARESGIWSSIASRAARLRIEM